MKCPICRRLMRLFGTNTNLYECPYCGYTNTKVAGLVVAQIGSTIISVTRQSTPKHE